MVPLIQTVLLVLLKVSLHSCISFCGVLHGVEDCFKIEVQVTRVDRLFQGFTYRAYLVNCRFSISICPNKFVGVGFSLSYDTFDKTLHGILGGLISH